jgi:hypothetical protein
MRIREELRRSSSIPSTSLAGATGGAPGVSRFAVFLDRARETPSEARMGREMKRDIEPTGNG